jgi:hypothetical protein
MAIASRPCQDLPRARASDGELEKSEAAAIKATAITVQSSHVMMLAHPKEVAELIEQAAAKAGSH